MSDINYIQGQEYIIEQRDKIPNKYSQCEKNLQNNKKAIHNMMAFCLDMYFGQE